MLASQLLGPPVRTAEMDPRTARGALMPGEESAVARAVDKRRREFIAGRTCARRAMLALGEPAAPIPQGEDRAPVWPAGLVGSITHSGTWCAAAVARAADGFRSLGLDIEPAEPLQADLLRIICRPEERAYLDQQPAGKLGLLGKIVFSAKEAAFKCQYGLSRAMLGFHAMRIDLNLPAQRFVAVFQQDAHPFARGDALQGRIVIADGHIVTAVALTH